MKSQKTGDIHEKQSILENVSPKPFYAILHDGKISKAYFEDKEDVSITNLKKAIVSFFQYKSTDGTEREIDISGDCDVSYIVWGVEKFTKTKLHCRLGDLKRYERLDYPLGVTVEPFSTTEYHTGVDGLVTKIDGQERHILKVNAYSNIGLMINSTFTLEVEEAVGNIDILSCGSLDDCTKFLKNVVEMELTSTIQKKCQDGKYSNVSSSKI